MLHSLQSPLSVLSVSVPPLCMSLYTSSLYLQKGETERDRERERQRKNSCVRNT